ncbi:hypothetical protein Clacol_005346 [Clathrus columnatus]|uniref:Uncharacterized protein n=1 Tax=Clathrus columnatus TaxID=1419009 RepID=A0AAV5A9V0_9AGAM|nr:hypothetical protein Clacol_005346 [Clathrus columnatus]
MKPEHRILILGCGNSTLSEEVRLEMDVRALIFENNYFDIAIDKGTMDAMMTVKGDVWNPPPQVIENCNKEVDEVIRTLRPTGHFLYLTFGQPHFRKRYLQRPGTTLKIIELGDAFHYYLYIMTNSEDVQQ